MKKSFLVFALVFAAFSTCLLAQQPSDNRSRREQFGKVIGKIFNDQTKDPLPYSSIALFNQRDSALVAGAISDELGSFEIQKVPYGNYYAEVKFIGFEKDFVPDIILSSANYIVDFGDIKLTEASKQLDEVTVNAERSPVEYHLDKKVVQVSENINAMGGSAAKVLENVPSITVDIDGNVSLRGSSSFTVLIDGKPSPLDGSDALRQIPASAVENIEIITNPSAKYDPDGLSGIINIITKKRALDGVSGIVNASIGTRDKYRGDFLFNYKNDKLTLFVGADYTDETRSGERNISQRTHKNDTTKYIVHTGESPFNRYGYTFKGGIGYKLNATNNISLEGSYGYSKFGRSSEEKFREYTIPSSVEDYYLLSESDARFEDFYSVTLNYEKLFSGKGHKLTSYLYYAKEWGGSNEYINQYNTDENWVIDDEDPYLIFAEEPGRESELRYQLDYTKPIGEAGKFESGYQLRNDQEDESYYFHEWDSDMNEWVINPLYTNSLVFKRNLQSLYGIYANQWLGFEYQLGLRGEYTFRSVKNAKSEFPSELERFDYFPTVHLSKKIAKQDQVLLNYSRRIRRPRGFELDPFLNYMDPNTARMGNPDLLPEYVDSYELGYQKGLGKSFISLESYYRLTHDVMTRVTEIQEDGTRLLTTKNLKEEHAAGVEMMFNFLVTKWFNFNLSGNLYKYKLIGNVSDSDVSNSSNNYDARSNLNFNITPTTRLQIQGFYQGPSVTAQGRREDFLMTNAALNQNFLKEKLSATLQIQDIFGTASFNHTNSGDDFYDEINMKRESQIVRLSLSFKINNYKKQNGQRDEIQQDQNGMDQQSDY